MNLSSRFWSPVLLVGMSLTLVSVADASTGPKRPGESAVPPIVVTSANQHLFAETSHRLWEISRSIDSASIQERQQRDFERLLQTLRERRAAKTKLQPMSRLHREPQLVEPISVERQIVNVPLLDDDNLVVPDFRLPRLPMEEPLLLVKSEASLKRLDAGAIRIEPAPLRPSDEFESPESWRPNTENADTSETEALNVSTKPAEPERLAVTDTQTVRKIPLAKPNESLRQSWDGVNVIVRTVKWWLFPVESLAIELLDIRRPLESEKQ